MTLHFIFIELPHNELVYWNYGIVPIFIALTLVLIVYMSYKYVVFYIRLEDDHTVIILKIAHICINKDFFVVYCFLGLIIKTIDQFMFNYPGEIWSYEYSILSNVLYKFNPSFEWSIMHVLECMYMYWAYWGSDSKVNIIIIQQRVHVDIIAEMYRICIEIKYIDANFLICVHMISYYFIVIAHVLNMSYVGFAAHCFKEIYTNFSALVQCFNMCKKSKSKECFFSCVFKLSLSY